MAVLLLPGTDLDICKQGEASLLRAGRPLAWNEQGSKRMVKQFRHVFICMEAFTRVKTFRIG